MVTYDPPQGNPLGNNPWFQFGANVIRPLLNLAVKKDWQGGEKLPKSGAAIVVCNHLSYIDPLTFTHFLFNSGRAPRYLGKMGVFKIPIIGKVIRGAGQIPVDRQSPNAAKAYEHAIAVLKAGHLLGVFPEGTLTRDENFWPMRGKSGVVKLALLTGAPVIPCAQWGPERVLPPYSKKIKLFPRTKISIRVGEPLDFSKWHGKVDDPIALEEATDYVMDEITTLLEGIRSETAPKVKFDPKKSDLPRIGNFKKARKRN
ncbi:MAG: 1-acyl-sn-glycerol-3-phosphate acyltransferase [Streptomycetaceae bacterium]|nr:MAG: 1-acyl-sn-glycerol-3-phosphate acyltransferase [Streptomycetaceae bacterium]